MNAMNQGHMHIQTGSAVDVKGEKFTVIGITNLTGEDMGLPMISSWGTHLLTLQRVNDGETFKATRYNSGQIGSLYPSRSKADTGKPYLS